MKFVNRTPQHRRNRLKIGTNFVATLPESDELEQKKMNTNLNRADPNLRQ